MLNYISVAEAIEHSGLRLVLTANMPGPWSVAARAIFDIKKISYIPVAQTIATRNEALRQWTGQEGAPAAMFENERPRTRWDEILLLAERLSPTPRLIPQVESDRADMFALAHSICSEDGLAWNIRLYGYAEQEKSNAARKASGLPFPFAADGLAVMQGRWGDPSRSSDQASERVRAIVTLLSARFRASRARGSRFMIGDSLTALDLYWTSFSNLLSPFADKDCAMPAFYRTLCEQYGRLWGDAMDPDLIAHREFILSNYFKLPIIF